MKQHRQPDAGSSSRSCLGHTCGTNIDIEGVNFTSKQSNLVHIDKVFSFNEDTASPILFNLNTGTPNNGLNSIIPNNSDFQVKLFLDGCDCSIIPCTLTADAVFEIDNSFVVVEYFNTRPPGNINASQVTLDGFPVDSVSYSNGQYTAKTANVLPRVQKDRCLDKGLPTKAFFLIDNAGPWDFRATFVIEGTVTTGGRLCRFRAEISSAPDSANISLPPGSLSSFAIRDLSLPCAINGVAPDINFQFTAKINLVNPRLVVNCGMRPYPYGSEAVGETDESETELNGNRNKHCLCLLCLQCPPVISPANCTVSLVTSLAIEPVVHVETVRRTLFCLDACEGLLPCQGSVTGAEIEEDIEDCIIGGVDRPDCRCESNDRINDCVWRRDAGNDCCPVRDEDDAFYCGCNDVQGSGRREKHQRNAFQFHSSNGCSW